MDGPVDVSVVIVNWNTRSLLLDVVESLEATTMETRVEIIVVDNASVDGSVAALVDQHPGTKVVVNAANYGFARAANIGMAMARGEAVCLVNTDVIALEGVLDTLWRYLRDHPRVAAVAPMTLDRDGRIRRNVRRFPNLRNAMGDHLRLRSVLPGVFPGRSLPPEAFESTRNAEVLSGCFLMVRREAVDDVGPLDEDFFFYGEDTDWARRFHDGGWDCVYLPTARAIHFGGGSMTDYPVEYYLHMEKADLHYWHKHHRRSVEMAYVAIRIAHNLASIAAWSMVWALRPGQRDRAGLKVRGNTRNTAWLVTRR